MSTQVAFDLVLVADGSGTKAETPCGWACVAYSKGHVRLHRGGTTGGSNNYAELSPFVYALGYHHGFLRELRPQAVLLVSDSELTVRCGSGQYARNANLPLWASIDWFSANGYSLTWRHVPRNSNPANSWADHAGRAVRKAIEALRVEAPDNGGQLHEVCLGLADQ